MSPSKVITTITFPQDCTPYLLIAVFTVLVPFQITWAGEPPEEEIDCEVYETESYGVTVGFRVGNMLINAGPDLTLTREQGVAWDRVSQGLIARFMEACTRYNAGAVTKEEYQRRLDDIERLYAEARELEQRMLQNVRDRKHSAVRRMEDVFAQKSRTKKEKQTESDQSDPIVLAADQLSKRIEDLEPLSGTLEPTKPCPPPDVIGTAGVSDSPCPSD